MSKQSIHCVLNKLHLMHVEAVACHLKQSVDTSIILLQTRQRNHVPGKYEGLLVSLPHHRMSPTSNTKQEDSYDAHYVGQRGR